MSEVPKYCSVRPGNTKDIKYAVKMRELCLIVGSNLNEFE